MAKLVRFVEADISPRTELIRLLARRLVKDFLASTQDEAANSSSFEEIETKSVEDGN
jgi:hypothetical protein